MAQAIVDLLLAHVGFLCAWPAIVALTGERVARRHGPRAGAEARAVAEPALGLVFLVAPTAFVLLGAAAGALGVPEPVRAPLAGAVALVVGSIVLHRAARWIVRRFPGLAAWGPAGLVAPVLALLCVAVAAWPLVGVVLFAAWVAVLRHRLQAARDRREAAARTRAARLFALRRRMGGEDTRFRR